MKREILFKGKLSHSKEWIEGNLIIAQNGKPYIIPFDVFEPDGNHLIIDSDNPFWVDEDTVSQFINQKDKTGKKIFEGDIFNYTKHKGYLYDDFQGEIKFEDGCFGFVVITGQVYRTFTPFSEIDELQSDFLNHIDIVGHTFDSGS